MRIFEAGEIVRVPFPYTDRATRQRRPALVVSKGAVGRDASLLWVAMITSAENASWADDLPILEHHSATGLPVASVIRPAKIATVGVADVEAIGRVSDETRQAAAKSIRRLLINRPLRRPCGRRSARG